MKIESMWVEWSDKEEIFQLVSFKESLVTPIVKHTSSVSSSASPETGSTENNSKTKRFNFADSELMSSLESEYNFGEQEEDSARSEAYDFRLFQEALNAASLQKQKR
jgi:hypothetical protein